MSYLHLVAGIIFIFLSLFIARLNNIPKTPFKMANHILMILVLMTSGIVMCYKFAVF
jgi:hypothetical protein